MIIITRGDITYGVKLNSWIPAKVFHANAWTFNGVIYVAGSVLSSALHCHEFTHIETEHMMGRLKAWFSYLWESRHGYASNKYEIEAFARQADPNQVITFFEVNTATMKIV